MIKNYKFGFDFWGLVIFLLIMTPNFIWFAVPAPNDILREQSLTAGFDMVASVCQVLMAAAICVLIHKKSRKIRFTSPLIIASLLGCVAYFTAWLFYYQGITDAVVILSLCVFPCIAFLLYEIERKNYIAIIPTTVFTVCHLIYGIVNFII